MAMTLHFHLKAKLHVATFYDSRQVKEGTKYFLPHSLMAEQGRMKVGWLQLTWPINIAC